MFNFYLFASNSFWILFTTHGYLVLVVIHISCQTVTDRELFIFWEKNYSKMFKCLQFSLHQIYEYPFLFWKLIFLFAWSFVHIHSGSKYNFPSRNEFQTQLCLILLSFILESELISCYCTVWGTIKLCVCCRA